ncbi:MAG: Ig-like domain repeat protein [Dietzia sp.]
MSAPSAHARPGVSPRSARFARAATVFLSALALVLGLAPAASAQSGSTRLGNFDFTATLDTGGSQLQPGGIARVAMLAQNHQAGFPYTPSVLNTYGVTMPAGFVGVGGGGSSMENVGNHDRPQNNFWGGQPSLIDRSVGRGSTRDGWLTLRIPENAQGGTVYQFGIMAHLGTGGSWNGPTNNVMRFTLPAVSTSTALTVNPIPARVGQATTLTARVSPSAGSNTPTGRVDFGVGGQTLSATVVNGVATTTATFDTAGSFPVSASFQPTSSTQWSTSIGNGAVNVQTEATQTSLTLDPVSVIEGDSVQASASVSPAGAEGEIEFSVGETTVRVPVASDGSATTELPAESAGEMIVTATFIPADPQRYTSSSDSRTVEVLEQISTSTSVGVDPEPVRAGEETVLTATITPSDASGTVTFTIGDQTHLATVTDGTATLAHTFSTTGEFPVTAEFTPTDTGRYSGSTGSTTVVVDAEATRTDLTLDPVEITAGGTIRASARVTPAGAAGEIEFTAGETTVRVAVDSDGSASADIPTESAGRLTVTATFIPADADRHTGSSDSRTVDIEAEATRTDLTLDPVEITAGGEVRASATITPADADGQVRFDYGDQTLTVPVASDGTAGASFTARSAGTGTITATFLPADPLRYTESSDSRTVDVIAESTQLSVTVGTDPVRAGEQATVTAIVAPAGASGTVTFTVGGQTFPAQVVGGIATVGYAFATTGDHPVVADFAPTDPGRYASSRGEATVTIAAEATRTDLTLDPVEVAAGGPVQASARVTPAGAIGEIEFAVGETSVRVPVDETGLADTELTAPAEGELTVTATFHPANSERYTGSSDSRSASVIEQSATSTTVTVDPTTGAPGEDVTLAAEVLPVEAAGVVRFTIDGVEYTSPVVDGVATLVHRPAEPGVYEVLVGFEPTDADAFAPSSTTTTVTVTDGADPAEPITGSLGTLDLVMLLESLAVLAGSTGEQGQG